MRNVWTRCLKKSLVSVQHVSGETATRDDGGGGGGRRARTDGGGADAQPAARNGTSLQRPGGPSGRCHRERTVPLRGRLSPAPVAATPDASAPRPRHCRGSPTRQPPPSLLGCPARPLGSRAELPPAVPARCRLRRRGVRCRSTPARGHVESARSACHTGTPCREATVQAHPEAPQAPHGQRQGRWVALHEQLPQCMPTGAYAESQCV